MGNPFENSPIPKPGGNKENNKMLFSDPELKVNVEAENADEAQKVFEKIRMQRDKDVNDAINSVPKFDNADWNIFEGEHSYFVDAAKKDLKEGDPNRALNYCLSQSINDKENNYTNVITKLRKWQLMFGKAESLASMDLAMSFLKQIGGSGKETQDQEILEMIQKNNYDNALGRVGEALVDIDRRIIAFEKGDPKYEDLSQDALKEDKFRKNVFERVRDTLMAEMKL
jgi:hypothetical protein